MAITPVTYRSSSPYARTEYIEGKFLDLLDYKPFPIEVDDLYRQVGPTYQYRPDLLSFDLYKTTEYWYVFMLRNRDTIIDPVWDFKAETRIYIPKVNTVLKYLGR